MPYKDPAKRQACWTACNKKHSPERKRAWYAAWAERRRQAVRDIKLARGCTDCGYRAHYAALQFDHLKDKAFTISAKHLNRPWEVVLEEIAKCDVVCANCHSIRTFNRRAGGR